MRIRSLAIAGGATMLVVGMGLQAQEGERRFGARAEVVEVQVPVTVSEGGLPVRGLTIENFQVFEGRTRQQIVGFEVIDLAAIDSGPGAAFDSEIPLSARRHFLLLFDLSFSSPGSVVKAREAARNLVATALHSTDLVAVATYAETRGAELALGFTADRTQLEAALTSLGLLDPVARKADPLKLVLQPELEQVIASGGGRTLGPTDGGGANIDGIMLEAIRDLSTFTARAERTAQINQILNLSGSLEELAGFLAAASGRKHVIYLSEGFDSSVILGTEDRGRMEEIQREAQSGNFWRVDSDERFGDSSAQSGFFEMLEQFRRCDCAIQAVDIGGVRAGAVAGGVEENQPVGQNGLFIMANQTGGELYRNYNNLSEAMAKLLDRTSVAYMLTLAPEEPALDGSYHPIEVRLTGASKRARVTHRPGYFAPRPYTELSPEERRFATAERILEGKEGGELGSSVLAVAFEGQAGRAQVVAYVEIDGFSLRQGHSGRQLPIEIFAYAIGEEGSASDYFSQGVMLDLEEVGAALDVRGFKFVGRLDLGPGKYEIRVLARNAATGVAGLSKTEVVVPSFADAEPALLPPLFIESRGLWLVGQERSTPGRDTRSPLISDGRSLVPSARPILKGGQSIPMMLLAHNLEPGAVTARGRLVSLADAGEVPVEITVDSRGVLAGAERVAATLHPGKVEGQGDYRLEVELDGAAGSLSSSIRVIVY